MLAEAVVGNSIASKTKSEDIPGLQNEAARQELEMKIAEAQARVAQEIAIARRIETASEVDIEEYYDLSGQGHLGLKAGESGLSLGAGAAGRRVRKRIYKFRGNEGPDEPSIVIEGSGEPAPETPASPTSNLPPKRSGG